METNKEDWEVQFERLRKKPPTYDEIKNFIKSLLSIQEEKIKKEERKSKLRE